ncbi:hypothetical protein GGI12_001285 [Dipsacomyces acuminosporus]|nr:hypothetical protein GGI12_001285 [Dipsacomyces acuminosporus]
MKLSVPSFKFGSTVVLAYPDLTRLAGYRAALELWTALAADAGSSIATASFDAKPQETVQPGVPALGGESGGDAAGISIVLGTPVSAAPDLTFCLVNGLPKQEEIPLLVDDLVSMFEANNVSRVIAAAAVNLSGIKDSDRMWVRLSASATSAATSPGLADVPMLPSGAHTNDAFLSALDNIASMSGIGEAILIVHGDKRPSGSAYRQRVAFGSEFVDDGDSALVQALGEALAVAAGVGSIASKLPPNVEATRIRLDVDSAAKGLSTFS